MTVGWVLLLAGCTGANDRTGRDTAGDTAQEGTPITLFYLGSDAAGDVGSAPGDHEIFAATSQDGVTFEEQGLVFTSDGGNDPDVFARGDGFGLFTSIGTELTYATSASLTGPFTGQEEVAWFGGGGPSTVRIGGTDDLFFCGGDGIDVSAITFDPVEIAPFTTALPNPATGFVCDPSVVEMPDGTWRMFVRWAPSLDALPYAHEVWSASSTDGLHYTADGTPVRAGASVPGAVVRDGVIYLYMVSGGTEPADTAGEEPVSTLGVAISEDSGATWEFSPVEIAGAARAHAYDPDPILAE